MANLVTSTEKLGDVAVWTANSATVTSDTFAAPAFAGANASYADTVADNSAVAQGQLAGTYYSGIAVDTSSVVGSVYIRKDAVTTRWPEIVVQINSGPIGYVNLNTSTGAIANGSTPPAASGIIDVDSLWWRLWLRVANNGTGTDVRILCYPDHLDALGGGSTSAGTGSVVLWGFNLTNTSAIQPYEPDPTYVYRGPLDGVSASGSVGFLRASGGDIAALSTGDTTTQFEFWRRTNQPNGDANTELRRDLGGYYSVGNPTVPDLTTYATKFVERKTS